MITPKIEQTVIDATALFIARMREELATPKQKFGRSRTFSADAIASGNLYDSIEATPPTVTNSADAGTLTLSVSAADYWEEVDRGRPPGETPPVTAILQWMRTRGIAAGEDDQEAIAFRIAKAIGEDGTIAEPSGFFSLQFPRFTTELGEVVTDAVSFSATSSVEALISAFKTQIEN